MCIVGQLPYWGCWLVEVPSPAELRLPVGMAHLQQLVLEDRLTPESWVAKDDRAEPQRLQDRPDLVPFASLRRKITRLYHSRQDDEAIHCIRRFVGFDGGRIQPDLSPIQFIEALIVEKHQPVRAESIYLELLGRQGHDLRWVIHNNLAVLRCRANRLTQALLHLGAAVDRDPPLVPALRNFRLLLEHILGTPVRALIAPTAADVEELEKDLAQVKARLEEVRTGADSHEAWRRSSMDPFAAILNLEDLAVGSAHPVVSNKGQVLALRCFRFARQALADGHWDQARLWANEAVKSDPDDPVVAMECDHLLALSLSREEQEKRNHYVALCRQSIPMIEERIQKNELPGAFEAARELLAQLDQAADLVSAETRGYVQSLMERIRRASAQQAFDAGMALRETAPEEAVKHWQQAAQHPDFYLEASTQIALLEQPKIEQEYKQALESGQFDKARACASRWADLSPAPIIQEAAHQWVERANRVQAERELDQVLRLIGRGRFEEARCLVHSAGLRHPAAKLRQSQFLEQIEHAEAEHLRILRETCADSTQARAATDDLREELTSRLQRLREQEEVFGLRAEYGVASPVPFAPVRALPEPRRFWMRCWSRLSGARNNEGGS